MGCRFEFRTQKLPYERISGNFFYFIDFGHQVRVCKKDNFSILAVFQNVWDLHKIGLQIWIQNAKITLWKNFVQFFWFHQFWSSGPGMQKKASFSILAVIQNLWDLHKFGLQIWIQNAKITLWKNFGQFFRFHRFWSSGPGMQKKVISQYYLQFKIYGTYINLGCRFEFRMQKLPHERISGNFSFFINFGHHAKK